MSRILIAYATQHGQTEKIARRIESTLRDGGHDVQVHDVRRSSAGLETAGLDVVVVGAPIHAGGYPRSVVQFVRKHLPLLKLASSAFFSVGLAVAGKVNDGREQTFPLVTQFLEKTGWCPDRVELIAGALPYTKYNFFLRFVMRRIAAKEGGDTDTSQDYEYTDWQAVDSFARQLVSESPT